MGLIDEIAHAIAAGARSCSRRRARTSRCGSCAASARTSTSATSRPRTSCRWRRSGSACAPTPPAPARSWHRMNERPRSGILLARHGETERQPRAAALPGVPRHAAERHRPPPGRRARRARRRQGIASLWSSDLSRASETAEIVGARIGLAAAPRRAPARGEPRRVGGTAVPRRRSARSPSATPPGCAAATTSGSPAASRCRTIDRVHAALEDIHADRRAAGAGRLPWGSIRVMLCRRDPRGLDAFHDFTVPNVAVVPW